MSGADKPTSKKVSVLSFNPSNTGFIKEDDKETPTDDLPSPQLPDIVLPEEDVLSTPTAISSAHPSDATLTATSTTEEPTAAQSHTDAIAPIPNSLSPSPLPSTSKLLPHHAVTDPSHLEARGDNQPQRRRTLSKPERQRRRQPTKGETKAGYVRHSDFFGRHESKLSKNEAGNVEDGQPSCWRLTANIFTCCFFPACLSHCGGMRDRHVQQAWREKVTLVLLIFILCVVVGFITFGLQPLLCKNNVLKIKASNAVDGSPAPSGTVIYLGKVYNLSAFAHPVVKPLVVDEPGNLLSFGNDGKGLDRQDVTFFFQKVENCNKLMKLSLTNMFPCSVDGTKGSEVQDACHLDSTRNIIRKQFKEIGSIFYEWQDLSKQFVVFNGQVLDLSRLDLMDIPSEFPHRKTLESFGGQDATRWISKQGPTFGSCLADTLAVGQVSKNTAGCMVSDIILFVSLGFILGVVLIRFVLAMVFSWLVSRRLGKEREIREAKLAKLEANRQERQERQERRAEGPFVAKQNRQSMRFSSKFSTLQPGDEPGSDKRPRYENPYGRPSSGIMPSAAPEVALSDPRLQVYPNEPDLTFLYTMMLVTCYSEGYDEISATLTSLAETSYPNSHKLIVLIADGMITGSGQTQSTPEICLSLLEQDEAVQGKGEPEAFSYVAIADGQKRHNMARVYAGHYRNPGGEGGKRCPMVVIVKCGTPEEAAGPKAGNRGKRDSQLILMGFLSKVMFNERMTPLEFDLFRKMHGIMSVTPDNFEVLVMVDADTKVYPDCVDRMVSVMEHDPRVMGLCGETKIANKTESWVTAIQVFEYYISHHLAKAFESIFGGVTCLPGCFCAYRIKAPKGQNDFWVPILANPAVVEAYAENVLSTLHQKNLLLLGEDRFLSTLMLRTFPKRKMVFVPAARCKTVVPSQFTVLLSQRRRWINSTVHNLLELLFVRDLCGIFCFSMQFVIFMELIGTLVLPAAIAFTIYLCISSLLGQPATTPLILLAVILGLPAILIVFTTRKLIYVLWMAIYLCSLPIWNFVLPVYAFWHFDDFTWGQTRVVAGEIKGDAHGNKEGEFDHSQIVMKRWDEYERDRRRQLMAVL